jgi:glycine cleavage system H lipoate-binding protein
MLRCPASAAKWSRASPSCLWNRRVKAIVSGELVEANEEIEWEATLVNTSPYDEGWLVKIKADDLGELDNLMRPSDPKFAEFIAAEREKYDK